MKKDAPRFTNKKCTPKNTRGSKTSDEKMHHVSRMRNTPLKMQGGSKTSDEKRGIVFHE
jgi:hypothetical protein